MPPRRCQSRTSELAFYWDEDDASIDEGGYSNRVCRRELLPHQPGSPDVDDAKETVEPASLLSRARGQETRESAAVWSPESPCFPNGPQQRVKSGALLPAPAYHSRSLRSASPSTRSQTVFKVPPSPRLTKEPLAGEPLEFLEQSRVLGRHALSSWSQDTMRHAETFSGRSPRSWASAGPDQAAPGGPAQVFVASQTPATTCIRAVSRVPNNLRTSEDLLCCPGRAPVSMSGLCPLVPSEPARHSSPGDSTGGAQDPPPSTPQTLTGANQRTNSIGINRRTKDASEASRRAVSTPLTSVSTRTEWGLFCPPRRELGDGPERPFLTLATQPSPSMQAVQQSALSGGQKEQPEVSQIS